MHILIIAIKSPIVFFKLCLCDNIFINKKILFNRINVGNINMSSYPDGYAKKRQSSVECDYLGLISVPPKKPRYSKR